MSVTIKDVAKRAGVSHGTVSNVLKGVTSVSLENVRKVEKAIKELGYRPDISARNLKMEGSRQIGVVFPNITDIFYSRLYTQLYRYFQGEGYEPLLCLTNGIPDIEQRVISMLEGAKAAGIILSTCCPSDKKIFGSLLSSGIPVVFIEHNIEGVDCNFIGFRNDKTIYSVVSDLFSNKYTRIGLIAMSSEYSSEQLCVDGYKNAHLDFGIKIDDRYIRYTGGSPEDAFVAAIRLVSMQDPPQAIICTNTLLLSGALGSLKYAPDLQLPLMVSLSENFWNDTRFQDAILIPRPSIQIGEIASKMLMENIRNSVFYEHQQILLDTSFDHIQKTQRVHRSKVQKTSSITAAIIEGDMADALQALLPEFFNKTGIQVNLNILPHEHLYDVLYEESEKSDTDVFCVDVFWLQEMASHGMFATLNESIDHTCLEKLDIQPEFLTDLAIFDGHIVGLPYHYCNQLLFYRKDLFDRLDLRRMFYEQYKTELRCPTGWGEFNAVARFFTRKYNPESPTTYGTTLASRFSSAAFCEFLPRLWSYGVDVFNQKNQITLSDHNAVRALKNYCESFQYANPSAKENWWHEQVHEFSRGDVAMMILYSSYASPLSDRNASCVAGKVGVSPIPGNCPVLGGWSLCINRNSKNFSPALEFIKWACGKELAVPMLLLGGQPTCRSVYESQEIRDMYPWIQKSFEVFPTSHRRKLPKGEKTIGAKRYEEIVARAVYDSVTGAQDPATSLQTAAQTLNSILNPSKK